MAKDPKEDNKHRAYKPTSGNHWNQLRDFPRNELCFCKSGKKFKKCHMNILPPCVDKKSADEIQRFFDLRKKGIPVDLIIEKTKDKNVGKVTSGDKLSEVKDEAPQP